MFSSPGLISCIRSGARVHPRIVLHFHQLRPQFGLRLHSHRDSLPQRPIGHVLSSGGSPCPSHAGREAELQLHLQLKLQHVSAFPALRDVSVLQETPKQRETTNGMQDGSIDDIIIIWPVQRFI